MDQQSLSLYGVDSVIMYVFMEKKTNTIAKVYVVRVSSLCSVIQSADLKVCLLAGSQVGK